MTHLQHIQMDEGFTNQFYYKMLPRYTDETLSIPLEKLASKVWLWGKKTTPRALNNNIKLAVKKNSESKNKQHHEKAAPQHQKCEWL